MIKQEDGEVKPHQEKMEILNLGVGEERKEVKVSMGHMYVCHGYEISIRGDARPDNGLLQLVLIFYTWLVALFLLTKVQHMFM